MSISRRPSRDGRKVAWQVRIDVDDFDTATGTRKRKQRVVGTFRTKKEAEKAERKALEDRDRGTLLDPTKTTVAELLDNWLGEKARDVTPQTAAGYEITNRIHLKPALGAIPVQRLTADRVQAQYTAWREQGMSDRTMRECHLRLSQALDMAVRFRLVTANVCKVVTPPKTTKARPDVWTTEQATWFMDIAEGHTLTPLWHLLLLEGMRRGEALGLRWQDINWDRGTAHIVQSVRAGIAKGEAIIQPRTKTTAGTRTVKLTTRTIVALKAHRVAQAERRLKTAGWSDHDLILTTGVGTPINPTNVRKHFDALVKAAELPRITPHGLRHTHATMLLKQGVAAKIVSERLGHASIGVTLDIYSHVLPDMQDTAAAAIDAVMGGDRTTG